MLFKIKKKKENFPKDFSTWKRIDKKFTTKQVLVEISESNTFLYVHILEVKAKYRNKGVGTKTMLKIIKYANEVKKCIMLKACDSFGSDLYRLIRFYEKFNFKNGYLKELCYRHNMYYLTVGSLHYNYIKSLNEQNNKISFFDHIKKLFLVERG